MSRRTVVRSAERPGALKPARTVARASAETANDEASTQNSSCTGAIVISSPASSGPRTAAAE